MLEEQKEEKIITDEIKRNGNTNLITDAKLQSGSQIFAIGDSHTLFFHNSMKIIEHWFRGNGPNLSITIYKQLQKELNLFQIGNILGDSGHLNCNIKENDYVIFYFGYNDIQKNIYLYAKDNWHNEITNLFTNYVSYVKNLSIKYKINPIISCIYPNPRLNAVDVKHNGTSEERKNYILFANNVLKISCNFYNISFLNIYDYITDEDGFIKENITKDFIHLDYNNKELRKFVEDEIFKFCK